MIVFSLVIADYEEDMKGIIEPWTIGWHTSALTTDLQEAEYQTNPILKLLFLFLMLSLETDEKLIFFP